MAGSRTSKGAGGRKPDGRDVLVQMGKKPTGKKRGAGKAGAPKRRPLGEAVRGWLKAVAISSLVGSVLGGGIVVGTMYRHALATVDERLQGPVWSVPGKILSGPLEVWPGLELTAEELAADLQAAGYARTTRPAQPGDFAVSERTVAVKVRAETGSGWTVKAGDVMVTFGDSGVRSVTPGGRASLAPVVLATVRGPDNENRSPVPLERIPEHVRHAVMAMEDARFYEHPGIDALGILRALAVNLTRQEWAQGGSSLTQQLAKNLFLSADRTAARKSQEALLALALERTLTKDEILQLYLNEIYLGQAAGSAICGVDAAARAFFGKPIERVSLGEAATLAGIISSPNPYSPLRHPDKARERRDIALGRMAELGWAAPDAVAAAKAAPLGVHASAGGRRAPWAVDAVVEHVESETGEGAIARDALVVQTTISPTLQRIAERAVSEGLTEVEAAHAGAAGAQAALAVVRARDGAVVALVGGRDYAASPYDRASLARRQIGSTIKPLTALAAFEADPTLSPALMLDDAPITRTHDGKDWTPANYDNAFVGLLPLRRVIAQSRNIPAVLLAERVGLKELRDRLRAVGLSGATDYPSAALGGFGATPLELAGAYAVLSGGTYHAPWMLRAAGKSGEAAAIDLPPQKADIRYSERATFLAWDVLREVLDTGTGTSAGPKWGVGPGAAGKSGTTDGAVDAWFAGVSGPYAIVAWVGFDRDKALGLTGSQGALPIWARFVAASGTDAEAPAAPAGLVELEVCASTGAPPCPDCVETYTEWFPAAAVPEPSCGLGGVLDGIFGDGPPRVGPGTAASAAAQREEAPPPPRPAPRNGWERWFGIGR